MVKNSKTKRETVLGLVLAMLLLAACGQDTNGSQADAGDQAGGEEPTGETVTWQHQTIPPESWFGSQVQREEYADALDEATDGRMQVEMFHSGGLGVSDSQIFNSVGSGVLESSDMFGVANSGELPLLSAMELPFYLPWDVELRRAVSDQLRPIFEEEFEARGVKLLAVSTLEPRVIFTTDPVENLEDLQGMSLRTVGAMETTLTRALGASPTAIDSADLYTALQQGVVDGYWLTDSATRDFNHYEVVNHLWEVDQGGATWFMVANLDAFESLPADLQEAVVEAGLATEDRMWEEVANAVEENRAWLTSEGGLTAHPTSEEDYAAMREQAEPLWEEWTEQTGDQGAEMFETMEATLSEHGY